MHNNVINKLKNVILQLNFPYVAYSPALSLSLVHLKHLASFYKRYPPPLSPLSLSRARIYLVVITYNIISLCR